VGPRARRDLGEHDWADEIGRQSDVTYFVIAELAGRPIGAMQIIDPRREPTHYWGAIGPGLRAIDIWIGAPADRGHGHGEQMMRHAMQTCFADPAVTAILIDPLATNTRALAFYRRIGFVDVGRQQFGEDDCLVQRITREAWHARWPADVPRASVGG
jgi:aminoglycoside 6'-N-acetyltransferase